MRWGYLRSSSFAPATFQARATGASFVSCSARSSGPMRARSSAALTGSRLATGPRAPGESHLSHLIPLNPGKSRLKKRLCPSAPGRSGERRKTEGGGGTQAAMTAGSPSPPSGGEGRGEVGRRAGCGLALVADETIRMALARCQQVGGRVPDSAGGRRPPLLGAPRACATCAGEGRKCRAMMRDADTALHGTSVKVDPSLPR